MEDIKAKIVIETGESVENIQKVGNAINEIGGTSKETGKDFSKLKETLTKSQSVTKSTTGVFGGLKNMIGSLTSIGIVIKLVDTLKDAFMSNQKVADTVSAVFQTINTVVSKLIEIFTSVVDQVSKSTNGFDALKKVMGGLLTLALTPIKLTFGAIKLFIQQAQLAWEESFFGDNDAKVSAKLRKDIEETKAGLVETGQKAFQAGKDIVMNLPEAISSVAEVVSKTVEKASDINVKAIYEQSKATIQLKNNAILAASRLQGLVEEYDRKAEKLRQIRDDEQVSIEDRIAANEKLGDTLKEQQSLMLQQANLKIAAARSEAAQNSQSIELQKAVIDAENERKAVLAQIAGFESEQLVNRTALLKEYAEMNKAVAENENKIKFDKIKANAELIQDELKKQLVLKSIADQEANDELARLQQNIDNTKKGTQARVDAEIAYSQKKAELEIRQQQQDNAIDNIKKKRLQDEFNAKSENELAIYNQKRQLLELEKMDALTKSQKLLEIAKSEAAEQIRIANERMASEIAAAEQQGLSTTAIKEKYRIQNENINNAIAKSEKDLAKAKIDAQVQAADAAASSLMGVSQLLGEQTGIGKTLAVASATISTFTSAQKAYESTVGIPVVGPFLAPINAALAVATGVQNVKKILAVQVPNGGGGGSVPTAGTAQTPISPQQASTQLNAATIQAVGNAASGTGKNFVLAKDIKDNQEREATLQRAARLG